MVGAKNKFSSFIEAAYPYELCDFSLGRNYSYAPLKGMFELIIFRLMKTAMIYSMIKEADGPLSYKNGLLEK